MPYKVELPPDLENSLDDLFLPKNSGDSGDTGAGIIEDQIVAVRIDSTVLDAEIWFAFADDWKPDDGDPRAVFYAHELVWLHEKTLEQLRQIHKVKLAFGVGTKVRK